MEFFAGILFTAFLLFIGKKAHLVKIEFGKYEDRPGTSNTAGNSSNNETNTQPK